MLRLSGSSRGFVRCISSVANNDVVIASAVRTPIGSFNGALSQVPAAKLGSIAVAAAVEKAGIKPADVQEVYLGNVLQANVGQAPARQAALGAKLPTSTICTTVHKVCASGLKAAMLGAGSIQLGHNEIVVAGGFESMSLAPYYVPKARGGYRYGNAELVDAIVRDGLSDAYDGSMMGNCAEACAKKHGWTRQQQDEYAIKSYERSAKAVKAGLFKDEIIPVTVKDRTGEKVMSEDEEYKNIKMDKVPTLKPAFQKDGTVTAANSSKINDGAAAMVLMSGARAKAMGVKPLARICGYGDAALKPVEFTDAPASAIPVALKRAGISLKDVDYFEVNEAFAVVALTNAKLLGVDIEKFNVNGGAVALGHPIGASGARILVTLINVLKQRNGRYGVAAICNGGGGASAMVIERL